MTGRTKPVPFYCWPIWMTILGARAVVFYGILTPFWMAVRAIAWVSEHPLLRRSLTRRSLRHPVCGIGAAVMGKESNLEGNLMEMNLRKDADGRVRFGDEMVGFQLVGRGDEIGKVDHASFDGLWATVAVGRISKSRYAIPPGRSGRDPENAQSSDRFTKDDVLESPEYDTGLGFDDILEVAVDSTTATSNARRR